MAAVPTSNTPQPHAQPNAKPGTSALAMMEKSIRFVRTAEIKANGVVEPHAQVDEFMVPSKESRKIGPMRDASRSAACMTHSVKIQGFRRVIGVRGSRKFEQRRQAVPASQRPHCPRVRAAWATERVPRFVHRGKSGRRARRHDARRHRDRDDSGAGVRPPTSRHRTRPMRDRRRPAPT